MISNYLIFGIAIVAGGIASISGFGVGSLLTPAFVPGLGIKLAVAAVAIPHVVGTGLRLWQLWKHVNWRVLKSFGLASAAGGLGGALLGHWLQSAALTAIFALLLIFAGLSGLTGMAKKMSFSGRAAWMAGIVSGVLGGLVGNQGGIRSAALLGFQLRRDAFVGTATAIALLVDGARLPVYLITEGRGILQVGNSVIVATIGVVVGTLIGRRLLARIDDRLFRQAVSGLLVLLGIYMGYRAFQPMQSD